MPAGRKPPPRRTAPAQPDATLPSDEQKATFDRIVPMLKAAHDEVSKLSAKKQDGVLNELKIRNINRVLEQVRPVLSDDPALEFLETLDVDTLPQNSDAAFLLGQWIATLERFREQHSVRQYGELVWRKRNDDDS
ncbi:hypothetical protein ACQP00_06295 [Dactylosporangium sp. CS-047395]|uniref:hypothetical protein n=1 Tax=Dactylosporangium sp. CS-047395 TaxID=3239936 RepID=UPI003D8E9725